MKVTFKDGSTGWAKIHHIYDGDSKPYATSLTVTRDNGEVLEGYSTVRAPDNFSRSQGRKWALVSLCKRNPGLTKADKTALFETVCPEFFATPKSKCTARISPVCESEDCLFSEEDFEVVENYYEQRKMIDWKRSISVSILFNLAFWGSVATLYWLAH